MRASFHEADPPPVSIRKAMVIWIGTDPIQSRVFSEAAQSQSLRCLLPAPHRSQGAQLWTRFRAGPGRAGPGWNWTQKAQSLSVRVRCGRLLLSVRSYHPVRQVTSAPVLSVRSHHHIPNDNDIIEFSHQALERCRCGGTFPTGLQLFTGSGRDLQGPVVPLRPHL
jgi:hypothetical protein